MLTQENVTALMEEMANFGVFYCEAEKAEYSPALLDAIFRFRIGRVAEELRKLQAIDKATGQPERGAA